MAQYNKEYFLNKFIADYVVTHQDMQDLIDSTLFYRDDIGFSLNYAVYIAPQTVVSSINYNHCNLIQLPNLSSQDPSIFIISNNSLTAFSFESSWSALTDFNCSYNNFISLNIPGHFNNITDLNCSNCTLTSFYLNCSTVHLTSLNLSWNSLPSDQIEDILHAVELGGSACAVDLAGGSNASHSSWSSKALVSEQNIINNGGSVISNP